MSVLQILRYTTYILNVSIMRNTKHEVAPESDDEDATELIYKVLIIGDIGTGKTSIIKKYVHNIFQKGYKSTIGVDFAMKTVKRNDFTIKLLLWDIAGQERFTNMTRVYYKDAHAAIVVFDITRVHTFNTIENWLEDLKLKLGETLPIYIFANKCDMCQDVDDITLEEYCKQHNIITYYKTSALSGNGINEGMDALINLLVEKEFSGPNKKLDKPNKTIDITHTNNQASRSRNNKPCCS